MPVLWHRVLTRGKGERRVSMNDCNPEFPDRMLICCDCGSSFSISACDQLFFHRRELRDPKRCPACRYKRSEDRLTSGPLREGEQVLVCISCGVNFLFSADEQQFFQQRGFTNTPKRCPRCRAMRRPREEAAMYSNRDRLRELWQARAVVPFAPSRGNPTYCRTCFDSRRTSP